MTHLGIRTGDTTNHEKAALLPRSRGRQNLRQSLLIPAILYAFIIIIIITGAELKAMQYKTHQVSPDQLLLDPNNYRFHDIRGYKEVKQTARYQEEGVQARALALLTDTTAFDLQSLRDSIRTNGYISIEQIVAVPYADDEAGNKRYLIIEGNRRVASLTTLLADNLAGAVDLADDIKKTLEEIPVVVLLGTEEEIASYQQTLMAIRHVAGIREWGPYQQAKLVVEMFEGCPSSK